jgi:hypothetical protein
LPANGLYDRILQEMERPLLTICLEATRGNQIKAAELLGSTATRCARSCASSTSVRGVPERRNDRSRHQHKKSSLSRRIFNWSRRINMERRIAMIFLALGASVGLLTYLV